MGEMMMIHKDMEQMHLCWAVVDLILLMVVVLVEEWAGIECSDWDRKMSRAFPSNHTDLQMGSVAEAFPC